MTRVLSFVAALSIVAAVPLVAPSARAQVSDADRNAARDLYNEGWSLQQAGRYNEALDRYQRSIAVFPAPTTAFRVAQCKEALGKLVEAAEDLRAITHAALPPNAPQAFVTAQRDAATELASVEPRIPKVTINVNPPGVQGLVVTIDGATMPNALVGVPRPVDPGTHTITAGAPGYGTAQQRVEVHERQTPIPEVTLTLQAGATTYNPNGGYSTGGYGNGGYTSGGYQAGGYNPYGQWIPPRRRPEGPRTALLLGVDVAAVVPTGSFGTSGSGNDGDLNHDLGSVGVGVGGEVGLRFARFVYIGAVVQPSFFTDSNNKSAFAMSVAGILGFMTNPEGLGFYGEIGGGIRYFEGEKNATSGSPQSANATGEDVILGIGLQFKAGSFRFIPKFEVEFGPHDDNLIGDIGSFHAFINLALSGYWELPLGVQHAPPPPPETPAPASPAE